MTMILATFASASLATFVGILLGFAGGYYVKSKYGNDPKAL